MKSLQLILIAGTVTLSGCGEGAPPAQTPAVSARSESLENDVDPAQLDPVPEGSLSSDAIGSECTIEYTWSHDVPRKGGAHHVQLRRALAGDEPAHWQVEDSWTPLGSSKPQIIRRTITDEQALLAFEAGIAAIREFDFATASSSPAADVPSVTLFVGSKEDATEIRIQDWYAVPPNLNSRVRAMLRELQTEVR